ncbi:MAG: alkaline phosphatase, partial [Desulfobulbaceae bacterium]|nr:alkaline phosphatase [Desulfobulbaceae bacterium]
GSAAAGTAMACGMKTNIGVISMAPDGVTPYNTLAEAAKKKGMKVGIVSSVSIDHATPAVFYAHQPSRSMYHEIGHDLAASGFDYFGGGGFKKVDGPLGNVLDAVTANGYRIVTDKDEFLALDPETGDKVVAYNHTLAGGQALYYEIDRPEDHISLAEFTAKGIELLDNPKGFFMMVEGGKIDWACHANDARAAIEDTLAFDEAVQEALDFYNQHPGQTLIVVTGDHECGGLTLGFAGTKYSTAYENIELQTLSYESFNNTFFTTYKTDSSWADDSDDMDDTLKTKIETSFGLVYDELSDHQKVQLERAFDKSMAEAEAKQAEIAVSRSEEEYLLYGGYEALTVTLTHLVNNNAGLSWTSYSHTGLPVPVMAKGKGCAEFQGFYDNTDLAKKIARSMRVRLNN